MYCNKYLRLIHFVQNKGDIKQVRIHESTNSKCHCIKGFEFAYGCNLILNYKCYNKTAKQCNITVPDIMQNMSSDNMD